MGKDIVQAGGSEMNDDYRALQIYAQPFWHSEAYIMGNREALLALKDAISQAINGYPQKVEAFVEFDGEGYDVWVCECTDDELRTLQSHYTDECCGSRNGMTSPGALCASKEEAK
jgi:hypothetical protein